MSDVTAVAAVDDGVSTKSRPYAPKAAFASLKNVDPALAEGLDSELGSVAASFTQFDADLEQIKSELPKINETVQQFDAGLNQVKAALPKLNEELGSVRDAMPQQIATVQASENAAAASAATAVTAATATQAASDAFVRTIAQQATAAKPEPPAVVEQPTYGSVAEAEKAIVDAGYVRDSQRHVWVQPGTGKTCKVVRTEKLQFIVQGA